MAHVYTWERIGRCLAEIRFVEKSEREWSFLCENATERYLKFCKEHPQLLQRVSQNDIACYLGISNVSLSRIVSKLSDAQ